jgi:hypothetical protein
MADLPGGASGLLVAGRATTEVYRIAPGGVSLIAELRGFERKAAEELSQWKTRVEERMPLEPARRRLRSPCC